MDKNRFEMVYSQGVVNSIEIWKDKETGAMSVSYTHLRAHET